MADSGQTLPIGQSVSMPGHFDTPVVLEKVRRLGAGLECRVRLPDGSLDEVVISADEAATLARTAAGPRILCLVEPADLQLLVESARIRLAYAHDSRFAVSLSGIRTLAATNRPQSLGSASLGSPGGRVLRSAPRENRVLERSLHGAQSPRRQSRCRSPMA